MDFEMLYLAAGVSALWAFFAWLYRSYRDDLLKQALFELRDELFDLAADGRLGFSDQGYTMLRGSLNGLLFEAERISLVGLVVLNYSSARSLRMKQIEESYRLKWEHAVGQLPEDVARDLESIRMRMNVRLVEHVVMSSALFWITLLPVVAVAVLRALGQRLAESVASRVAVTSGINGYDAFGSALSDDEVGNAAA